MNVASGVVPLAAAACAALTGALVLARRQLVVVTIRGPSMLPTYRTGDRVLVRRCRPPALRRHQVALIAEVDGAQWLIKRIAALPGDPVPDTVRPVVAGTRRVPAAQLVILGDGTNSHDSRQFGFVDAERVLGVVLARLPAHREADSTTKDSTLVSTNGWAGSTVTELDLSGPVG